MMTKIWGPPGWVFLHSITMGYPQEIDENNEEHILRREGMISLFESLQYVFPCSYCRKSYAKFIEEKPIREHVNNRETLVLWFYNIHNNVNTKLGVPECDIPTFEEFYEKYESYRSKCVQTTDDDRNKNKAKGCVVPKTGIKKRCVIDIIEEKDEESGEESGEESIIVRQICKDLSINDDDVQTMYISLQTLLSHQ